MICSYLAGFSWQRLSHKSHSYSKVQVLTSKRGTGTAFQRTAPQSLRLVKQYIFPSKRVSAEILKTNKCINHNLA